MFYEEEINLPDYKNNNCSIANLLVFVREINCMRICVEDVQIQMVSIHNLPSLRKDAMTRNLKRIKKESR